MHITAASDSLSLFPASLALFRPDRKDTHRILACLEVTSQRKPASANRVRLLEQKQQRHNDGNAHEQHEHERVEHEAEKVGNGCRIANG
mgnify:CR=1 FL=1